MLYKPFKPTRIAGLVASLALFGALGLTGLTADPPVRRHDGFGIGSALAQGAVLQAGAAIIRDLGIRSSMLWNDR